MKSQHQVGIIRGHLALGKSVSEVERNLLLYYTLGR